jgi:two-component system sensor histidine kinase/response regulator
MHHTILYVDDDQENLRTFRRLFRKQYNILLAESGEEGLQLLHEHSPIPVIITDQRMPEMTGIEFLEKTKEISPNSIRIIITGFTDVQALIDAINTGRVYRYITKPWDEQELYVTLKRAIESYELQINNAQLLVDLQRKNEDLERSYKTLQATQEKLIQSEKLASIGRLASRIAHELRNPIQSIRMGIELLREDLLRFPDSEDFQESFRTTVQRIDQEITAANKIVQDLLEYARNMKFEYTETDVNNLIDGVLFNLAEKITQYRISVNTNYEAIGTIIADGIRIRQVMLNIIQNSIEAMEQGGTLTITTTSQDENTMVVSVQDTGCGITPEHRQRIFEPFFTTKEQGVGLGMSIVHKIVEAHGGTIDIESQEGEGTTFTVTLRRKMDTL